MNRLWAAAGTICLFLFPQNASALARYECKGLTADKIVLTPYQDGSVNLSFNDGGVVATTKFSHHGDVFTAIYRDVEGVKGTLMVFVIDTIARNGYEVFYLPARPPGGASKITCWWYQN